MRATGLADDLGSLRSRAVVVGSLLVVVACALLYTWRPDGVGQVAFVGTAISCVAAMAIGPPLRNARPRRLWVLAALGALIFLFGLVNRDSTATIGPLEVADLFALSGYLTLIGWLVMLLRRLGKRPARGSALDTVAVAGGVSLAMWSVTVAPRLGQAVVSDSILWAIYPVLDVILISLSVQLILRLRAPALSMWVILFGLIMLQIVDTIYTVVWTDRPGAMIPALTSLFLFAYWGFALGACHPSVARITRPQPDVGLGIERARQRSALLLFMVSPAVVSTFYPIRGVVDALVRSSLLALVIIILFIRLAVTMSDLSRAEETSRHRASHDQLTDLPNRAAFLTSLEDRLAASHATSGIVAVLFLDFDDFKRVNDTWGHHVGDSLLIQIAARLAGSKGEREVLSRHGGDEFVLHTVVDHPDEALARAARMQRQFIEPMRAHGHRIRIGPSIGIACAFPGDGQSPGDLVRKADEALYEAKRNGRGLSVLFDTALESRSRDQSALAADLDEAILGDDLFVELQPIMGGHRLRRKVGWEALARWQHPQLGSVPPAMFVPMAEDRGLIVALGRTVLVRACRDAQRLRRALDDDSLFVSVNVSPMQLLDPEFCEHVAQTLQETGLPARCLWLELTETSLVDRGHASMNALQTLRAMGVTISVDDFGTGYASLQTLLTLPVNCVKLDRSLVSRIDEDAGEATDLLSSVVALLNSLHISMIVAEGVETRRQADVLLAVGCPMAQGWLYGFPQAADEIAGRHGRAFHGLAVAAAV